MVETDKDKAQNKIYQILPKVYFVLQILVGIYVSFWLLFNHQPKTGDDVEHLHSAWLVLQGQVPYKDFFQHHNPLMWYMFAPIMKIFAYDIIVFDAVRIISTLFMFATLFVSGLIVKRFVCQSWYSLILVIASIFPSYVVFTGQDFRPDNYMALSFILGIYFFFSYLDKAKSKDLVLSFVCMFLSFLFAQKIIFMLIIYAVMVLYFLYTKDIKVNDFIKALILPILGCIIFISWLAYHGMVETYWLSNYIFNLYIPDVYGNKVEPTKIEFYILSAIAFLGCIYFLIKGNKYVKIICIFWIFEAIQRFFYFSLDRHYYYFLLILNGMMIGAFIYVITKKYQISAYIFIILSICGCKIVYDYCSIGKLHPNYHRYVTPKYVVEQTNRCDSVLNGYGLTYGIFTKDVTYYWNLNGQLDVIGNKIGLAPLPDLNDAVYKHLPKIIYTAPYWDEKLHQQKINKPVHIIDVNLRNKYYRQSLFKDIFILKEKYQSMRRCQYDKATNSWKYFYKRQ